MIMVSGGVMATTDLVSAFTDVLMRAGETE